MTVTSKGKDFNQTSMGTQLTGLYYYVMNKSRMEVNDGEHTSIFGYVPTIQSISFNPFVEMSDNFLTIVPSDFDDSYFGKPNSGDNPIVYRLKTFNPYPKQLGTYRIVINRAELGADYETRMLYYPFKYYMLCDYINPPLIMKPELMNIIDGQITISVTVALSNSSKYNLYCSGYKKDNFGNVEGLLNNNPLLYPVGSSAYASFLATQGNSFNQSNMNGIAENDISFRQNVQSLNLNQNKQLVGGGLNAIGSALQGNFGGVLNASSNMVFDALGNKLQREFNTENTNQKQYNIESMALARKQDYLNTPRAMKTTGNDATFNVAFAESKVEIIEYGLQPIYESRIKNYFKRYGYAQNRYGIPIRTSRKYWNFIKTGHCELSSSKVPQRHLIELKNIFDSGITLWHVENGVEIRDYSKENIERS